MQKSKCCAVLLVCLPALCQPPASDPEYRKLRDAQLAESVIVENVVIRRDVGTITLKRGTVSFGLAVQGRVTEAVFLGEGAFKPDSPQFLSSGRTSGLRWALIPLMNRLNVHRGRRKCFRERAIELVSE